MTHAVWLPKAYDPSQRWPAILFLHGAGERGDDNALQLTVGLGPHLDRLDPPAVVVFPQCPLGVQWNRATGLALDALDQVCAQHPIDPDRISLTGISMGGAGAWTLAADHPQRWSALAPVCGWYDGNKEMPQIPIWIFHGDADRVIPVEHSRWMARKLGARARYTEFAGVGHNAWDPAYTTTDVVDWLVRQVRR
jgi:predicted peptidase